MVSNNLNEEENSFRRLAENLPGIVYRVLIEDDNRTIFFNDMVQTMTGYSPEDLKRGEVCSIDPLILPEDRLNVINIVKDAIENNVPFEVEYRINNKSGEVKWFSERGRPIRGGNGNPSYIDGVIFDITNQKEVEKKLTTSEKKFKTIFDESPIGIELYDSNGKLVNMNEGGLEIFGISHIDDVRGFDLFSDPNVPKEHLIKLKKGQIIRHEILFNFDLVKDLNLYKTKRSGKIWIDVLISPLYLEENNTVSNYLVQLQEITERKITEQKLKVLNEELDKKIHNRTNQLKKSEEKYRLITENVDGLISVSDQNMNFEYVNEKAYFNILGRSKEEIIGKSPLSWAHPEDAEKTIEAFKIGFEKGEGGIEARFKDKKGIYHWFDIKGKTFIDHDGKKKVLTISRDVTQNKQAEQIIIQEREKANLYLNVVEVILVALDRDGKITLLNKKGHELLGYDEGELIGKNWFEICLPPHDRERVYEYFKKLMAGEMELIKYYENPIWAKTGEERLISWSSVLFKDETGNVTGLLASGVDITERAIAEQKLIGSEANYRHLSNELELILDHIPALIFYKNKQNQFLRVNKLVADAYNLSKEELVGKSLFDLYPKEVAQAYWDDDLEVIASGKSKLNFEEAWETPEGKRWVSTSKIPNINEEGDITGILGFSRDITERKKKEEEVRLHSEIMTNMSDGVYLIRMEDLIIVYANPRFEEMFGYDPGEMIGKYIAIVNAPTDKTPEETKNEIVGILKDTREWHGEVLNIKKDGTPFWCYANISLFDHPEYGRVIVSVHTDITERKKVQEEVKESETRFKGIFESKMIGTLFWNANGVITDANDTFLDMIGYTRNEILSGAISWNSITPPEYTELDNKALEEIVTTGVMTPVEKEYIHKDGSRIPIIFGGASLPGPTLNGVAFVLDITERKNVEAELKESEEKFRIITEQSHMGIAIIQDDVFKYLNQKASEITGYSLKEMYSWKPNEYAKFLHPDDLEFMLEQASKKQMGDPDVIENYRYRGINKTEETIFIDHYSKTINFEGRSGVLLAFIDITDKVKAEKRLEESEEKFRKQNVFLSNILESLTHPFYVINVKDYRVVLANSTASSEGLEHGKYCYTLTHGNNKPCEAPCICPLKEVKETKRACVVEHIHYDTEGNEKIYEIYGYPILDKSGNVVQMIEYALDVTERKIAQHELKESEKRYRLLFESSPIGIGLSDLEGNILAMNQKMVEMTGFTLDEFNKTNLRNHYVDFNDRIILLSKLKDGGKVHNYELKLKKKDGTIYDASVNIESLYMGEKEVFLTNQEDITERKKIEQKLKESEENSRDLAHQWRTTFDAMSECVLLLDFEKIVIQCNQVTLDFLGKKDYAEIIGHSCMEIIHSPSTLEDRCPIVRMFESNKAETSIAQIGNKWCEISANPVINNEGRLIGAVQIITDITERRKTAQELIESEEKFRTIAEQSFMGIVIIQDGLFRYFNQRATDINGYSVEEIQNWKPYEFAKVIHPEDRDFVMEQARKKQEGQIDVVIHHKYRVIKKSGEIAWVDNYSKTINYKGRSANLVITEDITDKIIAEQQLKESEEKFRTIAERALMGIVIVQDNQIKYVNDALLNMLEYSQKEIHNWEKEDLTKLIHPEDLSFLREYREHLRSGDKSLKPYYSYRVLTKLGKVKWIDQLSKDILYEGRSAELVTIMDITEKKEVEFELIKLNKLKSELLRRTSHELRTPLVSIKGFSDLLLELHRDKLDDYVIKTIKQIKGGCSRLESLVNDILKTAELESGTVKLKKSKEDLSLLIKVCVRELEGLAELRDHTINLDIPDNLIVSFEKEQIYNVFTNILINAIKFTPYNGKIEVKSEINNDFIIVSIRDNGIGFTEQEKTQIFKQFGKIERYGQGYDVISEGSGLGLFISKKIVELHGGKIRVESEGRNKGSTFIISLPIDEK